jgi:hypothetical protein
MLRGWWVLLIGFFSVVWFGIFLVLGCCSFSALLRSGLFVALKLLASCVVVLGVSPFPASMT